MTQKFSFKQEANSPSPLWYRGFNDSFADKEFWYSRSYRLKFGPLDYTDGYAEGNITSFWRWHDYWRSTLKNREN